MRWLALLAIWLALPSAVGAFDKVGPTQSDVLANSESTSTASATVTNTITGATNKRARLYGVTARCSAGSAQLLIAVGGTQVWSSDAAFVGTTTKTVSWPVPLTSANGQSIVVSLGSCAAGNTGVLSVQGDVY